MRNEGTRTGSPPNRRGFRGCTINSEMRVRVQESRRAPLKEEERAQPLP